MSQANTLDFSLFPNILLACSNIQSRSEFFHHGCVIARVVASDMANLCSGGQEDEHDETSTTLLCLPYTQFPLI